MNAQLKEVMKQVRRIDIRSRRLADSTVGGRGRSVFRGRGIDFDEVREYVPGDEVRSIDWNVTARAGRPFIKKHREERELTIWLAVDISASGDFGSGARTKRELAAEIAGVIALCALRNGDRVGLLLFSDEVEIFIPPQKSRLHVLRLIHEVLACKPNRAGTNIPLALDHLTRMNKRHALLFVISDFQQSSEPEAASAALRKSLRRVGRRHDVIAIALRDPRERELPNIGLLAVEDAETGELVELDTGSSAVRQRFAAASQRERDALDRTLKREGVDQFAVDTEVPYLPALVAFFANRNRRRR